MTGTGPVLCPGNRQRWRNGTHAPRSHRSTGSGPARSWCRGLRCQRTPGLPGPGPEHCELYSPGALFSWPELQAMAADGVLTQLYQRGYLPPGVPCQSAASRPRRVPGGGAGDPAAGRGGPDDRGMDLRVRRGAGPPGAAGGRQPADFQPEVRARLHLPRSSAGAVRRREHGRPDGVQPAAHGCGRGHARGRGTGRAGPEGAVGPSRAGRAAPAAQARRRREPARPAQAGGAGEARRPRGRAGGAR